MHIEFNLVMANTSNYPNSEHDYDVVANYIHQKLCFMDKADIELGRPTAWHNLIELIRKNNAYPIRIEIMDMAEKILADEKKFIERDPGTFNVRLTQLGRDNCDKGIDIPPSVHQIRSDIFYC